MAEPPNMAVSVRLEHRDVNGTTADIRHDFRIGRIPKYVDQDRSYLNSEILRGPTPHTMRAECVKLRELTPKIRKMRSNAAVSTRMIITFGKGLQPHFDALDVQTQDQIYTEISETVADRVATSLLALVAHRDETAPHAHGQMLAVNKFGVPVSKVATPTVMSELQDIAHQTALKYLPMCERGTKKEDRIERGDDPSKIYNRSVKQLHTDLPKEIEAKQAELDAVTSQIPALTARVEEMRGRVDKLENEEKQRELTAAKVKRLRVYRSRLADRVGDLRSARDELTQLTAQIVEKQGLVMALEGRADQAEQKATRATERLQEAERAADAAEGRKSAAEASAAALEAEQTALGADVSTLTETRAQLQPEVSSLKNQKNTLQTEITQSQSDVAEAQKRAVQAQEAANAAEVGETAAQAALEALRAQNAALEKATRELAATKAQLQPEIASLTAQKETILIDGRKLFKARKALGIEIGELQETTQRLEARNSALETEFADIRDSLEILRPALQAADALQQMSELDLDEQHEVWETMASPDRDCGPLVYASAIRMVDPLFAPDVPLPRSRVVNENLEILHKCAQELFDGVLEATSAEDGCEGGAEAIRTRSVYLSQDGTVAGSGSEQDGPGVIGKAFRWAKAAFDGVKRGVGLAIAATRDGVAEELTVARASLFNVFEPRVQSALRLLLKAEAGGQNSKRNLDQERELSDFGDPEP